ncbi:hypothetical protein [Saccharopolyspora gloriosae]|uniref:hypothetical protein n=1 Tax=Saccharopolyspora gloriosae TaxID=455344 RepID=UPI001FB5DBA6|nr:hypothetical protein [Saccharopolyspora gloriosae]
MLVQGVGQWLPKIMGELGFEIGDALLVSAALGVGAAPGCSRRTTPTADSPCSRRWACSER